MKKSIIFFLCLFLTACAAPQKDAFMGATHLPVQQNTLLEGQSKAEIKATFGKPLAIRTEEPNALWTYRKNGCTHLIYFNKSEQVCYAETRGKNCSTLALANQLSQSGE